MKHLATAILFAILAYAFFNLDFLNKPQNEPPYSVDSISWNDKAYNYYLNKYQDHQSVIRAKNKLDKAKEQFLNAKTFQDQSDSLTNKQEAERYLKFIVQLIASQEKQDEERKAEIKEELNNLREK